MSLASSAAIAICDIIITRNSVHTHSTVTQFSTWQAESTWLKWGGVPPLKSRGTRLVCKCTCEDLTLSTLTLAISSMQLWLLADSIQDPEVVWTKVLVDLLDNFCLFSDNKRTGTS